MLPQEKIKPFLLHPIPLVRDFTVHYFYNKNYQPPDLMDWVFKATDKYGPENCIGLLAAAREFQLNDGHFARILNQLKELPCKEQYDLVRRQYEFLLLYAPAAFLRKNAKALLADCKLRELHGNIISRFLKRAPKNKIMTPNISISMKRCSLSKSSWPGTSPGSLSIRKSSQKGTQQKRRNAWKWNNSQAGSCKVIQLVWNKRE